VFAAFASIQVVLTALASVHFNSPLAVIALTADADATLASTVALAVDVNMDVVAMVAAPTMSETALTVTLEDVEIDSAASRTACADADIAEVQAIVAVAFSTLWLAPYENVPYKP